MSRWQGTPPAKCDISWCSNLITTEFSDALLRQFGCWGNVCPTCATRHEVQYGTGLGQRYEKRDDGQFHKVEG